MDTQVPLKGLESNNSVKTHWQHSYFFVCRRVRHGLPLFSPQCLSLSLSCLTFSALRRPGQNFFEWLAYLIFEKRWNFTPIVCSMLVARRVGQRSKNLWAKAPALLHVDFNCDDPRKQRYQINPNNTYDFTKLYFTITVMYTKIKCKYWSIKRYLTKIFGRNWSLLI